MALKRGFFSILLKPFNDFINKKKIERAEKLTLMKEPSYDSFKELKKIDGSLERFEEFLLKPGKIGIVLGARGSGKSALGMRFLENVKARKGKKIYALGFKKDKLPKWIKGVDNLSEVSNNSFLLADEGGIQFSSRSSMSSVNKLLSELLMISRHKDISILFITQNSSNIEVNTLRQADYLLLKRSSLLQLDFERKKIKDIYNEVKSGFKKFGDEAGLTYIYSDVYRGFVLNSLPGFWSEKISKGYSGKNENS